MPNLPRLIVVTAVALVGTLGRPAVAQDRQFGVKAGASISTIDKAGDPVSFDARGGLTGGVFGVLPLRGPLSLQAEMLVSDRGGSQPIDDPSLIQGTAATRLRFQYVDLPLLLRVNGPRAPGGRFHAFVGPTVSVRTAATQQLAFFGIGSYGFEADIGNRMRRLDLGLTVGAGMDLGRFFVIDGRYTFGLRDAITEVEGGPVRNRGFQATVGFRLF